MTTSRLMKGIKTGRHSNNRRSTSTAAIESLPKDLLIIEVVARVASHSFTDFINIKKCCKDFLDAAEDSYVYQHVSLDKFPLIQWRPDDKELSFLNRCKESKNMEILFREGLKEYFSYPKGNIGGLETLKIAAQKGHKEAKYVYGMIILCSENEELRKQGLEHVRFLRESRCVIRCRKKVQKLMECMWRNNSMLLHNKKTLCKCKSACKGWRVKEGRWLLLDDDDDDSNDINTCEYCRWDYELESLFGKALPRAYSG